MNVVAGVKILVLDDDEDVCQTITGIASLTGYDARWTTDSAACFSMLQHWSPDILLLDLAMPGMDGIDTLRTLARKGSSTKVIIVSGLGSRVLEAAARAAQESGLHVAGVLGKPFSPTRLREILKIAIAAGPVTALAAQGTRVQAELAITAARIEKALDRREFELYFQPKIECSTRTVIGFEGLARWQDPEVGLIMPDAFIPVAEAGSTIRRLTAQLAERALDWLGAHSALSQLTLALNISPRTLVDPEFPGWIQGQCVRRGVLPRQLVLEVTETANMQNPLMTLELLTQFRIHGFKLSIDDFGVGYSSLVQLARLPFSEMKIDKSFVMAARMDQEAQKIIVAIVGLAHALGLSVTAEGVEDLWVLDFLRDVGCDHAQGYLIGRPMPADLVEDWLKRWNPQQGAY